METIPCPGCRTPLGPEMTSCPICLRARSKYEITRAYAQLREDTARRKRLPFVIAGWLLAAGAAGYAAWSFRGPLLAAAASVRARAKRFADESEDARTLMGRAPAAPAAPPAEPAPAAGTLDPEKPLAAPAASTAPAAATAAPPAAPAPVDVTAAPVKRALTPVRLEDMRVPAYNAESQWLMYGRAYDVLTLRPASGVQLMFQGVEGAVVAAAMTDDEGRYIVVLPRVQEGSLAAMSGDPRYEPVVLCESDIPYGTLSADERRSLARSAQDGDARPAALSDPAGEASLHRDLYLAPRR